MRAIFNKLRFWRDKVGRQEAEIAVCLEFGNAKNPAQASGEQIFKLTHRQAEQLDTPNQIIAGSNTWCNDFATKTFGYYFMGDAVELRIQLHFSFGSGF